jgi:hypothetical protein
MPHHSSWLLVSWPSVHHFLQTQGLATCALIVAVGSLVHNIRQSRGDRHPRLKIMQEMNEDELYDWRIANVGRVPVNVDRVGVLVWSGRGLTRWLGRCRPREVWLDPVYEEPPPQTLSPGDAYTTAVPYHEILLSFKGNRPEEVGGHSAHL